MTAPQSRQLKAEEKDRAKAPQKAACQGVEESSRNDENCQIIAADIFAGSGALGLEAISRGAKFCLFVETEPKARGAIRENIDKMSLFGCTRLHRRDATKLKIAPGNLRGPFTHIFLDPPYNKGLWKPVLMKLRDQDLIADNGIIILEIAAEEAEEEEFRGFEVLADKAWGAARVVFMRLQT